MSHTRILFALALTVIALLLGCTQPDAPDDITPHDRLLDYVGSLESVIGSSRQEIKQVADEMAISINDLQAELNGTEWEIAVQLGSQIEEFSQSVDSESSVKLSERIEGMKELLAQAEQAIQFS